MNAAELSTEGLVSLFKVLSKPDALEVFLLASEGIENSTYAIEELGLTPKKYYARLKELVNIGFVRKTEGAYRQTSFGSMIYSHFLPAMERAYDARDKLELIAKVRGTQIEDDVRKLFEDELRISDFAESNVKLLKDYESLAIEVIDLFDSAEKNAIFASNYIDARVFDAVVRSLDRGVKYKCIIGKEVLSSKLQQIRMILSPKLAMSMMRLLASNSIDMNEFARVMDLHFSFCVVDDDRSIFEFYNPIVNEFIIAFLVKDRFIGEKLTKIFNELWKIGECHSTLSFLSSFKK